MASGSRKAVIAALLANAGIAIAKFVGFLITGATSMLAEAVHSVADSGNQGLLLWGVAAARRAPSSEHPFGHGRERYFWAFVVSLVIFSLGGLFAVREGLHKLADPHALTSPGVAIGILLVGIVLEGISFRTAIVEAREPRGSSSWWEFIRHSKTPELPVVLLEDLGALCGLALALLGVTTAAITGDGRWDGAGSVAIGVLLLIIAVILAIEMKSLLIGEAASQGARDQIHDAVLAGDEVERLIDLRTLHLGPDQLLVAAKLQFQRALSIDQLAAAIDAVEGRIRARVPIATIIYLEPDLFREERRAGD